LRVEHSLVEVETLRWLLEVLAAGTVAIVDEEHLRSGLGGLERCRHPCRSGTYHHELCRELLLGRVSGNGHLVGEGARRRSIATSRPETAVSMHASRPPRPSIVTAHSLHTPIPQKIPRFPLLGVVRHMS